VRLELSNDYIAAGLLDRAERLLKELLKDSKKAKPDALLQLTTIYQKEKEWDNAIDAIQTLIEDSRFKKDKSIRSVGAHFCCELAEQALNDGHSQLAKDHLKHAFRFDRNSARASLLLAKLEHVTKNYSRAIKELARLGNQHPHFISEVIEPMSECYAALGQDDALKDFEKYLKTSLAENFRISTLLKLADVVRKAEGDEAANQILSNKLQKNPSLRGVAALLDNHSASTGGQLKVDLHRSVETLRALEQSKQGYRCNHCGFETKSLYWQCSSCQKWDSVFPILGIEGE
jgi:lipopolysaccharide biosynthesis regulator YciM